LTLDVGCGGKKRGNIGIDLQKTSAVDIIADAHSLPFKQGVFSYCYIFSVLEHVKDPLCTLREIRRVLKPGGKLKILVPSWSLAKYG
jgi:ubiquinone/menaquinone biosynthesis C-methylase UbiE